MDGIESSGNDIELVEKHKTEKESLDKVYKAGQSDEEEFPEEAKKLFNLK